MVWAVLWAVAGLAYGPVFGPTSGFVFGAIGGAFLATLWGRRKLERVRIEQTHFYEGSLVFVAFFSLLLSAGFLSFFSAGQNWLWSLGGLTCSLVVAPLLSGTAAYIWNTRDAIYFRTYFRVSAWTSFGIGCGICCGTAIAMLIGLLAPGTFALHINSLTAAESPVAAVGSSWALLWQLTFCEPLLFRFVQPHVDQPFIWLSCWAIVGLLAGGIAGRLYGENDTLAVAQIEPDCEKPPQSEDSEFSHPVGNC